MDSSAIKLTLHSAACFLMGVVGYCTLAIGQTPTGQTDVPLQTPIKTWAILGDRATIASGLTDALLAELTAANMDLVERELLNQVVDEQTLRTLMSGLTAESKRLGQILKADALIVVTQESKPGEPGAGQPANRNSNPFSNPNVPPPRDRYRPPAPATAPQAEAKVIRLIMCECRKGLRIGELSIDMRPVTDQATLLSKYIVDRREQFAGGVRTIVGLSPLACRNLEHDYDHLHQRYFDMLTGRLMTIPGLAVLELKEARTIAGELGAGDQVADRLVPVMIECEYRVQGQELPKVQFKVRLTSDRVQSLESPELALDESGAWLGNELVDKILERGGSKPLELAEQQLLLAQRADYLMRLGDMTGAVQCREAFLLAEPSNASQRVSAIDNLLAHSTLPSTNAPIMGAGVREIATALVEQAARQVPILWDHLSYLIENQLIDQPAAIDLMQRMNRGSRSLTGKYAHLVQAIKKNPHVRDDLQVLLSANRRFVLRTAAKVLDLPDSPAASPESKVRQRANWHKYVAELVADDIAINAGAMESFQYMEQVVLERIPETLPTSWDLLNAITTYQRSFSALRIANMDYTFETVDIAIDEEAMQRWITRIANSRHAHLRWYGQTVRLLNRLPKRGETLSEEVQSELDQVIAEIRSRPYSDLRWNSGMLLDVVLDRLEMERRQRTPESSRPKTEPTARPPFPADEVIGGSLAVEKLNAQFPAGVEGIRSYISSGRGVDIVACNRHVGLLRDPLTFVPIHVSHALMPSTVWDGQHVWIGEKGKGVFQYDLNGNLVRRITEKEGLPRHDHAIQLMSLQPNQVLVYGAIEPDHRCWLALLSIEKGLPQIKLVHEARQPYRPVVNPRNADVPLPNSDPAMVFPLTWWGAVQTENRQVSFIGRQTLPLAIDLKTGQVVAVALEPSAARPLGSMLARNGSIFIAYGTGVAQYDLPADSLQPRFRRLVINSLPSGTFPIWVDYPPRIMEHDGWIYKPGQVWYRFRPDGASSQRLILPESIRYFEYGSTASSSIFGMVGWSSQVSAPNLYKITVPK